MLTMFSAGEVQKAIENSERRLNIALESGDRAAQGQAYGNLGIAYFVLGDFRKVIEYLEKDLNTAIEIGDKAGRGKTYRTLGYAHFSLSNFRRAIEYHGKDLNLAIEVGDRVREGEAYGNLGIAYDSLGDFRKAIECHEKDLKIAIEIGDRAGQGRAYGNLGIAYYSLGDLREAIEHHENHLKIAIKLGDREGEGRAYGNLGNSYRSLGDPGEAIEYHEKHLKIAIEFGDQAGEGRAFGNLGSAYHSMGNFRKAIEYNEYLLNIAIETGDRAGEAQAYGNLGNALHSLRDFRKAIEYHEKDLGIAIEIGNRNGEGETYANLGLAYFSLGDFQKSIEYLERSVNIAIQIGNRALEGDAYGKFGSAYFSLGDFQKAIEHHKKNLNVAIEIGNREGELRAYGSLGNAYHSMGDFRKAIEYHEISLKIAIKTRDRNGEGISYHNIGNGYFSLGQFENAVQSYLSALEAFNTLRSLLKSEDVWKIKFREGYENSYIALCSSLLRIGKIDEALVAAEQGRAQTLSDNLLIQYKIAPTLVASTFDSKEIITRFLTEVSTPIIFLGIEGFTINIWFLSRGNKIAFRQGWLEGDITDKDPILVLLQVAIKKITPDAVVRCEDRTFDELDNECIFREEECKDVENSFQCSDNPFRLFHDAVIGPIVDMLGSQDNELVIVSEGALCLTPWAAVIESIKIRTVPSLTSYQLILSVPEGYHKKTGALLVGNPCLSQLKKPLRDLPCAQEEVEMIARILNTRPLTGRQATKAGVMKQMSSVGLIHIAAHGDRRSGRIALSPNPGWTSQFPKEDDFILKMSDVQAANLRARLVVLSCCHSGRGRILKGEGVVGIARAFLTAGARSVLVSLWAIDDEATMVFMKRFYQYLKKGKTASAAVHQAMKFLRESNEYSAMRYWAPFQLIGDDVKIDFEVADDVKE